MTGKCVPLRVWLCVYFVNINFIAFAGAPLRWCVKCVDAFIFSEGATNDDDDSTSTSTLPAPNPKQKKNQIQFRVENKKNCRLLHVEYAVNRLYFLQPKGISFAVHAFYREKCRLEACIGIGEMGGVRLNTCQYCASPPPHSLSSNKFFFISFVIYLWLIMQRRKGEPHRKSGVGDFSVLCCGRRRHRYSAIHIHTQMTMMTQKSVQ